MSEQMIADIANAIYEALFDADNGINDCGPLISKRHAVTAATAAHSVMAGKVVELEGELVRVQAAAFGIRAEEIAAALAPYPERRSE